MLYKLYDVLLLLMQIIRAVTATPARVFNRQDEIGSLGIGKEADITVVKIVPTQLECQGIPQ